MRIAHLIPGSGNAFYCENCLRDAGLMRALRELGHDATGVPMYLPAMSDAAEDLDGSPVFFGGVNVYLQQKFGLFRRTPRWVDRLFDRPWLLRWAARKAGMTGAGELAETTLSMLRGGGGRQAKELDRLVGWLSAAGPPDVVCLSNALLAGVAAKIKADLGAGVVCALQGEDEFLDAFPEPLRRQAWQELTARAEHVDAFLAVSHYYADLMRRRLSLPADRLHVAHAGISLDGYGPPGEPHAPPVIGYLSRLCPAKGLDTLVEAFVRLRSRGRAGNLKLRVAGGWTAADLPYIKQVRRRLQRLGLGGEAEFLPNLDRAGRQAFLRSLSLLSVPSRTGEAFGVYILEALASGVPVVQPAHGASVELVQATGGGVLVEPNDPQALAAAMEELLLDGDRLRALGRRGREAVQKGFTVLHMAGKVARVCEKVAGGRAVEPSSSEQPHA
jgi:glycosyltransferase involved in cell wall biosynthesis